MYYLDTSALVKLVVAESSALLGWFRGQQGDPGLDKQGQQSAVTCDLSRTELYRAVRRVEPTRLTCVREVLSTVSVISVTTETFERVARLDPTTLRSIDAVHVAAALALGDELSGFVAYDEHLLEAARANGIPTVTPR